MPQAINSSRLLEPALPGAWIANCQDIWQMDFLNANKFASFGHERGLSLFNEKDVVQLWQLGIIKADLISSCKRLRLVGLVDRGKNNSGYYLYSDERPLPRRLKEWENARKNLKPLQKGVELLFHPFRYYVLYHIDRVLKLNASRMQMLYQEGYQQIFDLCLSLFNRWSHSEQFASSIEKWNDTASLAIIAEPHIYGRIFHSIRLPSLHVGSVEDGVIQARQQIASYWNDVEKIYHRIGKERLEEIRQELCIDTQMLDPNRWVHTLLCLGEGKFRTELEGHLGGALLLRTMAEMLRRTTEAVFHVTLREEDELGFGWVPENVKKELYGSNRVLDGDENVAKEYIHQHELHYGLHLRFYVEGATEAQALQYAFQTIGARYIEIINLGGEVAQKRGKGVAFRENLRSDIAMHVFSMVLIDGDRPDFVSAVKKAAVDDEICGCFYISRQDFEFANFELSELEEILWSIAREEGKESALNETDRDVLHEAIKNAKNAEELIKQARKTLPQLNDVSKGERWGRKLIDFAGKYPIMRGKQRQVIEAIQTAVRAKNAKYEITRREYKVDENTGQPVKRDTPLAE